MKASRFVRPWLAGFVACSVLFAAFTTARASDSSWTRDDAAHLLRRAGFGGTPEQIERLHALGETGAVDYLITGKLSPGAQAPFEHVELKPFESDAGLDQFKGPERQFEMQKLRAWWIDRMVRTDRPLDEKMALFWHGLFTSGIRECKVPRWLAQQNELFHREAIGNYKRLTHEIIHDPAMLKYLNNDENMRGRPNENLARELMELFTMGEGNGYTEKDIPEVARALTGMTPRRPMMGGRAVFLPQRHDNGPKTIFGQTGNFGPDDVVELIFNRPYPSDHLARRLWIYFGTPEPTAEEIAPVASALKSNHWDLAPALRALFLHPDFYSQKAKFALIKSPIELEVGTLRLLEEPSEPRIDMAASVAARQLGEDLFQPPNVKGWPGGEHWITSAAIYTRYNVATAMANGAFGAQGFGGLRQLNPKAAGASAKGEAASDNSAVRSDSSTRNDADAAGASSENPRKTARKQVQKQQFQQERQKIRQELQAMPALPEPSQLVQPARLFPSLAKDATPDQLIDAAMARFLQQPLPAEKRQVLMDAMGKQPLNPGEEQSDRRVRQMIGLLMSTPEYQME